MLPEEVFSHLKLLRRFQHYSTGDYFYTTTTHTEGFGPEYVELTPIGYIFSSPAPGLKPLLRYRREKPYLLHLYTSNEAEDAAKAGYVFERIEGYVFAPDHKPRDAVHLSRWYKHATGVHLLTTTPAMDHPGTFGFVNEDNKENGFIYPYSGKNWMHYVNENKLLSALTIPGTHDTATYLTDMSLAQCQQIDIQQQLERGVRFLDFRLHVGLFFEGTQSLWFSHGADPLGVHLNLTFSQALQMCSDFLAANPSECIIMSVKDENDDREKLERLILPTLQPFADAGRISTGTSIPHLRDVRGKIVLLRRFEHYPGNADVGGIDASGALWPQNSTETHTNHWGVTLRIQDEYKSYSGFNVDTKFDVYMKPVLDEARADPDMEKLYINFSSGTGFMAPIVVSRYINPKLHDYLLKSPPARYGILPMDVPDEMGDRLLNVIIATNTFTDPNAAFIPAGQVTESATLS
ncbi:Phosphatidylinositol-specific phospholipase C, X domain [Collimonas sp. OK607]|uniref:phosphatidylinositol-specific phospholipase C domain-containing protein n=1 Tax=Collimonas sp. OK607 TaxID=1798194 RepID=UPI0008E9E746|nr:phosphatidylinositol-specific phospholipase C domain-containing protein [Collimonas sp. OK607]SFB12283.1 Phosphatidylinositol-specific phospholipase C, X domain [Collimonas sp. OK607]